jgi:hypothetical protein
VSKKNPVIQRPHVDALPTVRALHALWEEVSEKPLYAYPHFFTYVKLRWKMRMTLASPETVKVAGNPFKASDCSGCLENCCVGPSSTVLLRLVDIAALIDTGRTDLISMEKPSFDFSKMHQNTVLQRQVSSESWHRFPVLKKSTIGACAALSSEGQCSLFPYWPLSCERFPYAYRPEDHTVFYSPRCDSFWVRPSESSRVQRMAVAAVASYNERIKDAVLLAYKPNVLKDLGLLDFLSSDKS